MTTTTKTLLIIGAILILVGLVSIPSPLALQWLATIGVVMLVVAFSNTGAPRRNKRGCVD